MENINIKDTYKGIDLLIAQKCDDGDGIFKKDEESILIKAKQEFEESGEKQETTIKGVKYYYNKYINAFLEFPQKLQEISTEITDALRVKKEYYPDIKIEKPTIEDSAEKTKEEIVSKMYKKWSGVFKKSPLKESFYSKLYDVIKTMHCSVSDDKFNSSEYSSKEEQTMDEVIAIFAGEAQLNPKCVNGPYNGLFQLGKPGLTEAKAWAAKHKNIPGMNNVKEDMTISEFLNISGEDQLDYLVAYIGKCREYSKLSPDEEISPGQVWAMIKYPFKGKSNSNITAQKNNAIKKVFINNEIPPGIS